jgi:methyl-accepting chemotaxis protein
MSLRNQLLCILLVLGLLVSGRFLMDMLEAHEIELRTAIAVEANQRTGELMGVRAALALERGLTSAVLANPGPATASTWQTAQARRAEAETALDATLAAIAAQPAFAASPAVPAAVARLQRARAAVHQLRTRVDAVAGQAQPTGPLGAEFYAAMVAEIDAVMALDRTIEGSQAGAADTMGPMLALRDVLREAAEYTGRQRGATNGIISRGTPMTPAESRQLAVNQGFVESALTRLDVHLAQVSDPALIAAAERARAAMRDEFLPLRNRVITASDEGRAYPLTAAQWFAAASTAIDTLEAAQRLATAALQRAGAAQLNAADWRQMMALAALLMVIAVVGLMILQVFRALLRPLKGILDSVRAMTRGELQSPVPGGQKHNEIGVLARAVEGFRLGMLQAEADRDALAQAERLGIAKQEEALRGMADLVEGETRQGIALMARQMDQVVLGSSQLSSAADRVMAESRSSSEASAEALESAQAVASATEELGASIAEITARLADASRSTRVAAELGTSGRAMIEALSEAVGRIGGVARLIGSIAGQTNLLALNATIEAARSGEAGKGFAVVAGEVKALASQTAKATEEISREIGAVMRSTEQAVTVVRSMADAVAEVDQVTTAIAAAMEEQSAATREIAGAVARAAAASQRVSDGMAEVADASTESSSEADAMRTSSAVAQDAIEEVRKTIIRVVRQSVAVADRRASPRRDIPCDAHIMLYGSQQRIPAQLRDISEGGFGLAKCDRGLAAGEHIVLRADSLLPGIDLPAEVLAVHHDGSTNCRFLALRSDAVAALATLVQDGRIDRAA